MIYVLQVLTGQEMAISGKLKEAGISGSVPRENRLVRVKGSWTKREYCLMPGYVFIDINLSPERYYLVTGLPGVIRFLGYDGKPASLSYLEAEWLRVLSGEHGEAVEPTIVRFGSDGTAEIAGGILKYFESRIIKIEKRSRRATFAITILGEVKEITLSVEIEGEKLSEGRGTALSCGTEEILKEAT